MSETLNPYSTLSIEEVESFVENGFLVLRNCFRSEDAARLVEEALDPENTKTIYTRRTHHSEDQLVSIPHEIQRTEKPELGRVDIDTQRYFSMAEFAPRLWGAIADLVGDARLPIRKHMGDKWILRFKEPRSRLRNILGPGESTSFYWHIDQPSQSGTIEYRTDALTLLIYWSDVDEKGGTTLYSPKSIDGMLRVFNESPDGADIANKKLGLKAVPSEDIRAFTGRSGDVVITHALCMHSGSWNTTGALRVLENPSITLNRPLDFDPHNGNPSPVERCITRRFDQYPRLRARCADLGRQQRTMVNGLRWLVLQHPDYFLPDRTRWSQRVSEAEQLRIHGIDQQLFTLWIHDLYKRSRNRAPQIKNKIEFGLYAVLGRLIGRADDNSLLRFETPEHPDFTKTATARLLRGFTNQAALREVVRSYLVHHGFSIGLFEAINPNDAAQSRLMLMIDTQEGSCLLDTQNKVGPFVCEKLFEERDRSALPGLRSAEQLKTEVNVVPSHWITAGRMCTEMSASEEAHNPPLDLPEADPVSPHSLTAWQRFLLARLDHVCFQYKLGENPYNELLQSGLFKGLTQNVIERMSKDFHIGEPGKTPCETWPENPAKAERYGD